MTDDNTADASPDFGIARSPRDDRGRVLYVGGWLRSGSTLLCEALGSLRGALAIGELSGIWHAVAENQPCSCGAPVRECSIWSRAIEAVQAKHGLDADGYADFSTRAWRYLRPQTTVRVARMIGTDRGRWPTDVARYVDLTDTMLDAIREASGARVLVDSSKLPPPFLLHALAGTPVDLVQVVRDPRAVANSELKTRVRTGADAALLPPGRSALKSAAAWSIANLSLRGVKRYADRYVTVDYSRLTTDPEGQLDALARRLDLERGEGPMLGGGHMAVGNPARLRSGDGAISQDLAWQKELARRNRVVVSGLTAIPRLAMRLSRIDD